MTRDIYLRPLSLIPDARADTAEEVAGALPLAGGRLAFMGLEVALRTSRGIETRIFGLSEFFQRDWGGLTLEASRQIEAIRGSRPRVGGLSLDAPRIMGIVNVTPDSFSDGGRLGTAQAAIDHAFRLEEEGADILDIGGESTRPGSDPVSLRDELARVIPVIEGLAGKTKALISVDTRKSQVMRRAAEAGADIINDVAALTHESDAMEAAAETGLPVILMHAQGDPKTMQVAPVYANVALDVLEYLDGRIAACEAAGIPRARIIADPGIGFGKTLRHNLGLLSALSLFHALGVPLLLGASRKSFIKALTGAEQPEARVYGSIGAALAAVAQGCQIIRVHDVKATREALTLWEASSAGGTQV